MIFKFLLKHEKKNGHLTFLEFENKRFSYSTAHDKTVIAVNTMTKYLDRSKKMRILIQIPNSPELIFTILACDAIRSDHCIVSTDYNQSELEDIIKRFHFNVFITCKENLKNFPEIEVINYKSLFVNQEKASDTDFIKEYHDKEASSVIVLTTGTTGLPKGAIYTWSQMINQVKISEKLVNTRWLLAYQLNHFAGLQVFLTTLCNGGTLVVTSNWDVEYLAKLIGTKNIEYISATPTFWRITLPILSKESKSYNFVKQITMGGEAITSNILELSKQLFPNANITQIFATTEMGPVFSVKDEKIGFPLDYVNNPEKHDLIARIKIEDGELFVKTPHHMKTFYGRKDNFTKDGWYPTGDLVKIVGERVLFMGRKTETINVGGVKVHPVEVEEVIQTIEGIKIAKVYGKSNPITGKIVVADIVVQPGFDPLKVKKDIMKQCNITLSRQKVPKMIYIKEDIDISNFKLVRRGKNNE